MESSIVLCFESFSHHVCKLSAYYNEHCAFDYYYAVCDQTCEKRV